MNHDEVAGWLTSTLPAAAASIELLNKPLIITRMAKQSGTLARDGMFLSVFVVLQASA